MTTRVDHNLATPARPLRLALVDADEVVQRAVCSHFSRPPMGWHVDSYTNVPEALQGLPAARPQVVLMEQSLGGMCALECTRKLRAVLPELPVVMFTAQAEPGTVLNALTAGAGGYLIKPVLPADLLPHLRKAITGGLALCDRAERLLLAGLARLGQGNPWGLTHREQEAMLWLSRHKSDKEIGMAMGLANGTAQVHLKHAFKKLGAHGRRQAIEKYLSTIPPGGVGGGLPSARMLRLRATT